MSYNTPATARRLAQSTAGLNVTTVLARFVLNLAFTARLLALTMETLQPEQVRLWLKQTTLGRRQKSEE